MQKRKTHFNMSRFKGFLETLTHLNLLKTIQSSRTKTLTNNLLMSFKRVAQCESGTRTSRLWDSVPGKVGPGTPLIRFKSGPQDPLRSSKMGPPRFRHFLTNFFSRIFHLFFFLLICFFYSVLNSKLYNISPCPVSQALSGE